MSKICITGITISRPYWDSENNLIKKGYFENKAYIGDQLSYFTSFLEYPKVTAARLTVTAAKRDLKERDMSRIER